MSNTQISQQEATKTTTSTARSVQVPQTLDVKDAGVSSNISSSSSNNNARATTTTSSTEKASAALSQIVQLFSTTELHKTVATVYIKTAGKPCEGWSIGNLLLMYIAETADGRTYAAWQRAGRHVKKGARAFYILEPRFVTKVKTDQSTGEPVLSEGKPVVYQVLAGFKASPRFRYEDTEGTPLKEYKPRQMPPLANVAQKWGVSIRYKNTTRGEQGYFEPGTNSIVLCVEDQSTFFHELAHKAHSRIEELKPVQDPEQETVAELTACTLSEMYGYHDTKGNSYDYIAHYANSHAPEQVGRLCMRVLDKVRKVLDLILQQADDKDGEGNSESSKKEEEGGAGGEKKPITVQVNSLDAIAAAETETA